MRYIILILIIIILSLLLFQKCEEEPRVITKTVTKVETKDIKEPINNYKIGLPKRYVVVEIETKKIDYRDSIVYVPYNLTDSLKLNRYPISLLSNKAKFEGFALTSGKLYDFDGVISYPETTITNNTETVIREAQSGLFGFIQSNTRLNMFGAGLDWQIKNKFIVGANVTHNTIFENTNINLKLGIRL